MSSILERPKLNKIFLIYGNLDDMFISPDLQKNNFRPYLTAYLQSLGYEQIVFYSGAKNTGKYVLDDKSAVLAINKNKMRGADSASCTAGSQTMSANASAPKKHRRILNPKARKNGAADENNQVQNNMAENPANNVGQTVQNNCMKNDKKAEKKQGETKLIYKQPKITPAEFLDDAKKMMADGHIKTAVVFSFFQDFITDTSAPLQQYSELLSHLWDEYSLNVNDNICIFLAPQMEEESIKNLFDSLTGGNILKNRFFNENETINRSCTIKIGLPNQDEFKYMLEYLRLVGDSGKKISYKYSELPRMLSSLMYLSRQAEKEENRAGYLSAVYENIIWYIRRQSENIVEFNEDVINKIYSKFQSADNTDPLEKLKNTRGWESVAKRIGEITADYKQKKAAALAELPAVKEKKIRVCASERIDTPDDDFEFDYPIPHFILKGNPGVGKTTVARLIGQILYENGILKKGLTIEATRNDLVDKYVGGTTEKTRNAVISAEESVLFIDDAYSLIDKSEDNNYSRQAIDELVAIMTNPKQYRFCMIMAGYPEPMDELLKMNAGLSSRFSKANILTIEDYPPDLLRDIFVSNCKKDGYRFWGEAEGEEEPLDLDLFFKNMYNQRDRANFGNARDVVAIAREAKMQSSLRDDQKRCITQDDFNDYKKYFKKNGASSIDDIYAEIDRYVGMDFVKELFENVRLEILDVQDCKRRGIKPDVYPDHFIFSGNPGTGKTTVGKMVGKFYHLMGAMGGAETLFVDASEFIGGHVGESKKLTAEKIQDAIDHNSILYVDEAYQITESPFANEIIGAMMTKMTENAADFKLIFGMYTDRVEAFLNLNPGLSRRVRIVDFPDYNAKQLVEIFERTVKEQGRTVSDECLRLISILMEYKYNTRTEHFGNAGEVKKLVADMKKLLLKRVSKITDDSIDRYQYTEDDIPPEQLELIKDQINPKTFDDIMEELNQQIGMSDLKDIIVRKQEEIMYAKKSGGSIYGIKPGYYFFMGNPGTGKSTSAKLFGECLRELGIIKTNNFYSCTAKDLIGQYVGETDKKTYAVLKKAINGVLFIDEAYSLSYAGSSDSGSSYKKEALEQIIAFMDEPEHRATCCIIFAGYPEDMQGLYQSNSGMRSRIEEVHFKDYSASEMYQIFALFCKKAGYALADGVEEYYVPIFEKMIHMEYYSNGRTARTVFEKTEANLKHRVVHDLETDEASAHTIMMKDLLSEEECLRIVDSV